MKTKIVLGALVSLTALSFPADAHRAWLKPSATVLSGDAPFITVDAAISNTLFHADHHAMSLNGVEVTAPNGTSLELLNSSSGKYRSVFDLELTQQGTYRIASASAGLRAFWRDEEGNRKMWPGRGQQANESEFATAVPQNADELRVMRSSRRIESFATVGAPTYEVLEPTGHGLELAFHTHPNDLYATETATFQFFIDGEPAAGVEVEVVRGGMRYRNSQEEITLVSNAEGMVEVTWPEAGMYFMEASYQDDQAAAPATIRSGGYAGTFEVLPL
ncbi:DUF4198 domain-containing protein [Lysobacter sp. N42]|uniref:DUF4198 domain-containing protein n=1 Tax=Lysobacter sp. N42 TaxID=2545719 RepID=UPI001A9CCF1E|nr:DUF4198 domain-containing protein [Lysobacter sp. N42]